MAEIVYLDLPVRAYTELRGKPYVWEILYTSPAGASWSGYGTNPDQAMLGLRNTIQTMVNRYKKNLPGLRANLRGLGVPFEFRDEESCVAREVEIEAASSWAVRITYEEG